MIPSILLGLFWGTVALLLGADAGTTAGIGIASALLCWAFLYAIGRSRDD